MTIDRPFETRFPYTDYFDLGLAYNPDARNILFVGLGGASAPKRIWRDFPSLDLQVAELDPVVVDVARQYFGMPDSPRLKVAVEDGRRYLQRNEQRYDVIALDAYFSDSIPFHSPRPSSSTWCGSGLRRAAWSSRTSSVPSRARLAALPLVRPHLPHRVPDRRRPPVIDEGDGGELTELRNLMLVASEGALPRRSS